MQTTNTQFDFDDYSESDQAAVLDMAKQMGRLGETIKNRDIASARAIYDYLSTKQKDYVTSGYDNYEIITCCDFTSDVIDALESGDKTSYSNVVKLYNYLYLGGPEPKGITW